MYGHARCAWREGGGRLFLMCGGLCAAGSDKGCVRSRDRLHQGLSSARKPATEGRDSRAARRRMSGLFWSSNGALEQQRVCVAGRIARWPTLVPGLCPRPPAAPRHSGHLAFPPLRTPSALLGPHCCRAANLKAASSELAGFLLLVPASLPFTVGRALVQRHLPGGPAGSARSREPHPFFSTESLPSEVCLLTGSRAPPAMQAWRSPAPPLRSWQPSSRGSSCGTAASMRAGARACSRSSPCTLPCATPTSVRTGWRRKFLLGCGGKWQSGIVGCQPPAPLHVAPLADPVRLLSCRPCVPSQCSPAQRQRDGEP